VRHLKNIGLRRGKRKALHIIGYVNEISGEGPFRIGIEKWIVGGRLCNLETEKSMEKGPVWIVVVPYNKEGVKKGLSMSLIRLTEKEDTIYAEFESEDGPITRAKLHLDNRGRAKNLVEGDNYRFELLSPRRFFSSYEIKSLPVGGVGRSEPSEIGKRRIELISGLSGSGSGSRVLDSATGPKDYLKAISSTSSQLVCANLSTPILKKTREWLEISGSEFVRYDVDRGFPFKNQSFDLVILDALLEYTQDPLQVLERAADILKTQGRLIVLEPIMGKNLPKFYPQDLWEVAIWRPIGDKKFLKESFTELLEERGLKLVERKALDFEYILFSKESFSQTIGMFKKLFIEESS
jgi:SAM-dependent methyltransferase